MPTNPNFRVNGNINPSSFVMADTVTPEDFACLQATANAKLLGVSQEGSAYAPIPNAPAYAGVVGGPNMRVYGDGEVCLLTLGADCVFDDELVADADGNGIPRATTGATNQNVGARALEAGADGEKISVQVVRYPVRPT